MIELADEGLGPGWRSAGAVSVLLHRRLERLLVAYSCDKNLGLYRERVGALFLACARLAKRPRYTVSS